ncbi:MAG: phosphate ABC transporter permease subunit PstC [Alphaproteobacteria bacterium]|nr:phosphate ABC transporter permease subunit PstC [Alphaproteobacteria bacterium]
MRSLWLEKLVRRFCFLCTFIAVMITVGIFASLVGEAFRFFTRVSVFDFLFGLTWSPHTLETGENVGFGAIPLFTGTALITLIALIVAIPCGTLVAIYLSEYASTTLRAVLKPILEILAGIPTLVYGFFAATILSPFLRDIAGTFHFSLSSESAFNAGLVMGIMILPYMSSLCEEAIHNLPTSLREGSMGLGATSSETILRVLLPAAFPNLMAAFLLSLSRAIGETMIVVMAAGLAANLSFNPLEAVTTVTVQIVNLLTGDQEFDNAKTLAAFGLGFVLFILTLFLNILALYGVKRYKRIYG